MARRSEYSPRYSTSSSLCDRWETIAQSRLFYTIRSISGYLTGILNAISVCLIASIFNCEHDVRLKWLSRAVYDHLATSITGGCHRGLRGKWHCLSVCTLMSGCRFRSVLCCRELSPVPPPVLPRPLVGPRSRGRVTKSTRDSQCHNFFQIFLFYIHQIPHSSGYQRI